MARRVKLLLLLGAASLVPHIASANAGTPLMWAGMFHLLIGNAVIGMFEAVILQRKYDLAIKPYYRMAAANYFSAWLGAYGLSWLATQVDWNLDNGRLMFGLFALLAYLMTIVVEWPFVLWCFPKTNRSWKQSLRASGLIQTCSYVVLFGGYWLVGSTSIYSEAKVVRPREIELTADVSVFYLGPDGRVHRNGQVFKDFASSNRNDRLYFEPTPNQTNAWDLYAGIDIRPSREWQSIQLASALTGKVACVEVLRDSDGRVKKTRGNFGKALTVGVSTNTPWHLWSSFWEGGGLRVNNTDTGERYGFSWETPFSQWTIRNVILLPEDQALFQLGEDQICVLDLKTRRIALWVRGRGPAVLLE